MEFLSEWPLWTQILFWGYIGSIVINLALLLPLRLRVNTHQETAAIVLEVAERSILWPVTWAYTFWDDMIVYGQFREYIRHFFGAVFGKEEYIKWFDVR